MEGEKQREFGLQRPQPENTQDLQLSSNRQLEFPQRRQREQQNDAVKGDAQNGKGQSELEVIETVLGVREVVPCR
jgi:hypothetical protein